MSSDSSESVDRANCSTDSGGSAADGESTDGGYVHEPGSVEAGAATATASTESAASTDSTASTDEPYRGEPAGEGFGRQGWLLVAGVVVCFLVIPGFIYLNPTAPAQIGWTFFATFLVLPLLPAVLLGLLAVWSMQAAA